MISPCWVMNIWHRCGQLEGICTMWLPELGTFAMFYGLKKPSITKTDILWYDLHEYVCWFCCNARIPCPSAPWPSLTPIMDYPLCMPHDLATANRHDHAWTENWAQNICTLRKPLSLMRPGYAHRKGDRRGHFYGTEGRWINCPTCSALLDVGFMIVLRRAGW